MHDTVQDRTGTFLIRACVEVSFHCSYANDESLFDAVHTLCSRIGSFACKYNSL